MGKELNSLLFSRAVSLFSMLVSGPLTTEREGGQRVQGDWLSLYSTLPGKSLQYKNTKSWFNLISQQRPSLQPEAWSYQYTDEQNYQAQKNPM